MFRKIVDVLKEVFWISSSKKGTVPLKGRGQSPSRSRRKTVKKSPVKKKVANQKGTVPLKSRGQSPSTSTKLVPVKTKALPAKKTAKSAVKVIDPSLKEVGEITHYFERIKVCVVKLTQGTVLIGDKLSILGDKTKFIQKVWSMQIESEDVKVAKKGQIIGLKVDKLVAVGDKVYK